MSGTFYVILPKKDVTQSMLHESLYPKGSFRTSIDGKKAVLKFDEQYPITMGGYEKLTESEFDTKVEGDPKWGNGTDAENEAIVRKSIDSGFITVNSQTVGINLTLDLSCRSQIQIYNTGNKIVLISTESTIIASSNVIEVTKGSNINFDVDDLQRLYVFLKTPGSGDIFIIEKE